MTFDQLPLYIAIYKTREWIGTQPDLYTPSSEKWTGECERQLWALVMDELARDSSWPRDSMPWSIKDVADAYFVMRKSSKPDGCMDNKIVLTVKVALVRGRTCFWPNFGNQECNSEINLDRLIPGDVYSLANCVISCTFHNQQRSNRSVDEYIRMFGPKIISG